MPVHVRDDGSIGRGGFHEQVMFVYDWKQVFSTCCVQFPCQIKCTAVAVGARSKVIVDSIIDDAADGGSRGKLVRNSWPVFRSISDPLWWNLQCVVSVSIHFNFRSQHHIMCRKRNSG